MGASGTEPGAFLTANGASATGNVNVRNNQIRNFCWENDKILYDFADIESYNPNGQVNYTAWYANDNSDNKDCFISEIK